MPRIPSAHGAQFYVSDDGKFSMSRAKLVTLPVLVLGFIAAIFNLRPAPPESAPASHTSEVAVEIPAATETQAAEVAVGVPAVTESPAMAILKTSSAGMVG